MPRDRCVQISDHDLIFGEIVGAAFPLLYPPPYDGGGMSKLEYRCQNLKFCLKSKTGWA